MSGPLLLTTGPALFNTSMSAEWELLSRRSVIILVPVVVMFVVSEGTPSVRYHAGPLPEKGN